MWIGDRERSYEASEASSAARAGRVAPLSTSETPMTKYASARSTGSSSRSAMLSRWSPRAWHSSICAWASEIIAIARMTGGLGGRPSTWHSWRQRR